MLTHCRKTFFNYRISYTSLPFREDDRERKGQREWEERDREREGERERERVRERSIEKERHRRKMKEEIKESKNKKMCIYVCTWEGIFKRYFMIDEHLTRHFVYYVECLWSPPPFLWSMSTTLFNSMVSTNQGSNFSFFYCRISFGFSLI